MLKTKIELKSGEVEVIHSHTVIDLENNVLKIYDVGYYEMPLSDIKNIESWED